MKLIIVNADDFGINGIVTSEIERAIINRYVTSTTIMANGECLDEVRRFANEHPEVSFGVHLCLSEFSSLTKREEFRLAGLTDENGVFVKKAIFRLKDYSDNTLLSAIRDELNAQIDVVSSLGIPVSHADSHHHVHTIYPLNYIFGKVLHERGISKIRLGSDYRTLRLRLHFSDWMNRIRINNFYRSQFMTTDAFYSYTDFVNEGTTRHNEKIVELMCHPGHPAERYRKEMELVGNETVIKRIQANLVSYMNI
jgi:predicted glycoside hydrolase/deacetylase ChbG (UPF0249 family)